MRNLSVTFDKYLTWESHIGAGQKCGYILFRRPRLRRQITLELVPPLVNAFDPLAREMLYFRR